MFVILWLEGVVGKNCNLLEITNKKILQLFIFTKMCQFLVEIKKKNSFKFNLFCMSFNSIRLQLPMHVTQFFLVPQ